MELDEEKVRKELEEILKNVKNVDDLNNFKFIMENYIEEGYNVRYFISKYNSVVNNICNQKGKEN